MSGGAGFRPILTRIDQNGLGRVEVLDHANADAATLAGAHWEPSLPPGCPAVLVTNLSSSSTYYVRLDGQPAAAGKGSVPLPPLTARLFALAGGCSIVGTGDVDVHPVAQD